MITTTLSGLNIQGNLIVAELLPELLAGEGKGQSPDSFGLKKSDKLADEIASAWGNAKAYWIAFQRAVDQLPESDTATTVTRKLLVMPLLRTLGYAPDVATAEIVDGLLYAISHRAEPGEKQPPVHIIGSRVRLEERPLSGTPRLSAHALMQEYLNQTEHLWAVVTNGHQWRLLRDSPLMTRLTYVEFDLEQILNGENFAEFGLFYRLFHRTRLPKSMDAADECLLEYYYQKSLQQGGRVRDRLRDGVESALTILGTGFLQHPKSQSLRDKLDARILTEMVYYRQILMLIYRLLFLMVAESRNLLLSPENLEQARIYREYYSIERLRTLGDRPSWRREGFQDLWQGLRVTFQLFDENWRGKVLGLSPLAGGLFCSDTLGDLEDCAIDNHDLSLAIRQLSLYEQKGHLQRVNYGALDVEELGSVYESLLDFQPQVTHREGLWEFQLVMASNRKMTGSYYAPPELVGQLVKNALEPVIADRLEALGKDATVAQQERALLKLKICDPACGSGHFLLAAARRVGKELARVRTGETQPGLEPLRAAIRDVICHCIYGVDLNPLAVDLCKVALWLEGLCRTLSLNFLDHRIKCGNSLVGVLDLDCLKEGIPDNAYKASIGDDKKLATQLKKRNRQERQHMDSGQGLLPLFNIFERDREEYTKVWCEIESMKDDDPSAVRQKQAKYERSRHLVSWLRDRSACNLWTAVFFIPLTEEYLQFLPTSEILANLLKGNWATQSIVNAANQLAKNKRFFHWPLEFPEVFRGSNSSQTMSKKENSHDAVLTTNNSLLYGFDCVIGNPPWEPIHFEEREVFSPRSLEFSLYMNQNSDHKEAFSFQEFQGLNQGTIAQKKFIRSSKRYLTASRHNINTYIVFTETSRRILSDSGRLGIFPAQISLVNFQKSKLMACILTSINSLTFKYFSQVKTSESALAQSLLKKLPVVPPKSYVYADIDFIFSRTKKLKLGHAFSHEYDYQQAQHNSTFQFNHHQLDSQLPFNVLLSAELDAYYAHLYGLSRDELCFILDSTELCSDTPPRDNSRCLESKEIEKNGEYCAKRLVLEVWDSLFGPPR